MNKPKLLKKTLKKDSFEDMDLGSFGDDLNLGLESSDNNNSS